MDTLQISKYLTRLAKGTKAQVEVIPCDGLQTLQIKTYPVLLCVNNMPSTHPGQHWLGIYIKSKASEIEFYDSYGMGIDFYDANFINFAKNLESTVLENLVPVQGNFQNSCGHFVIFFLWNRLRGCPRRTLYCKFSRDFSRNDRIVRQFVNRIFIRHSKSKFENKINQICKCKNEYE